MIDVIAFDADDTLWHTEYYYREAEKRFLAMLAGYGISDEAALTVLHEIEIDNLVYFGYGIRGFILSMIDTAVQVTGGQVRSTDIRALVDLGREMTSHEIRLLDGVEEALAQLSGRRLLLITKGDALDQESKIHRSGLAGYFNAIEVVVDKSPSAYATVLARHAVEPHRFMMVGNSLRSDIAPVLALGGFAVYVPYPMSWEFEAAVELPADHNRFFELSSLRHLSGLVSQIESAR